jgi:RHS repeat-associated protein
MLVLAGACFLGASALAAPSSSKIGTAALITPANGLSYYNAQSPPDYSLVISRPDEVIELSRALQNNVDQIYDFVRNNVEITFMHGLQKGALGALLDRNGTAFDQAHLMVELLLQAGYTSAKYKYGTITLTSAQFSTWTGISKARAACQLLASGGIPAQINGSSGNVLCTTFGANTNISSVVMAHVWVEVNIGGTNYWFDPAYKAHTATTGINLTTATGLSAGQPLSTATTGMTSGTASTVPYVKNLNAESLATQLGTYGTNLLNYINTNNATSSVEQLLGITPITRQSVPPTGLRQTTLPYTSSVSSTWTTGIPRPYRTTLRVEVAKDVYEPSDPNGFVRVTGIDKTVYVDEVYGRKMVVVPNFPFAAPASQIQDVSLTLVLRDRSNASVAPLASYTRTSDQAWRREGAIKLTVNHPYAASASGAATTNGDYMDAVADKRATLLEPVTIIDSFGQAGADLATAWGTRNDSAAPEIPFDANGCDECEQFYYSSRGDARRDEMAVNWQIQAARAGQLHAAIASAIYTHHHSLGIASADTWAPGVIPSGGGFPVYYVVQDSFDRIDVDDAFSVTNKTANSASRNAAVHAIAATTDALEGAVAGQIADLPDTSSTATRFEWGNRPPAAEDLSGGVGPRRFYRYSASNAAQAISLTMGEGQFSNTNDGRHNNGQWGEPELSSSQFNSFRNNLTNAISDYASNGFDVVTAEESFLGPGQRGGVARLISGTPISWANSPAQQRGGAIVATRYSGIDPVEIAHAVVGFDETSKGGGGGVQSNQQSQYDPSKAADILKTKFVDRSKVVGVDLQTGQVTYVAPAEIVAGNGEFPYSLSAQLIWRGGPLPDTRFGPVIHTQPQVPWTTNWNNSLTVSSSALEAMGTSDGRLAAVTIAAFLAQQDVYKGAVSAQREVAGLLVASWWLKQLRHNVVTVNIGADTRQFVRQANGLFLRPGAAPYETLTQTGTPMIAMWNCTSAVAFTPTRGWNFAGMTFDVRNANGDVQHFVHWQNDYALGPQGTCGKMRGFRMTSWTFPQGVNVNLVYTSPGAGQLDRLTEVNNNLGRKIQFTYESGLDGRLSGYTNGLSGADLRTVAFTYTALGSIGVINTVTDPSNAQTRFTTDGSGGLHRLIDVYDADDSALVPSLRYSYDTLNRVKEARDAVALQGTRNPHQFFIGESVRAERLDPAGGRYTVLYDLNRRPMQVIDEIGRATTIAYDGRGRPTSYTYPEGNREDLQYDTRNNVTQLTKVAKPGSGLANIVVSATWDTTWNKPLTVVDGRGYRTNFAYYASGNGASLLQTATRPGAVGATPIGTSTRPVYSFTYNSFGQVLDATDPTGLITRNAYNPTNGNLESVTLNPGGVNAVTGFSYDALGNVRVKTDPRLNVTELLYDASRRQTHALHHDGGIAANVIAAERTNYDLLGQVTSKDAGVSFSGTTVTAWQMVESTTYTPNGFVSTSKNGADNLTSYTYDGADRVVVVTDPEDRRIGTNFDLAGQALCVWRGWNSTSAPTTCTFNPATYGGTGPVRYAQYSYSANGQQTTVLDANSNLTTLEYDGHDRLLKQRFPLPTLSANASSTTDFEQYGYDPNGNQTSLRKRDGQTIGITYDNLNRVTRKDIPSTTTLDVYYDYDLADRRLFARSGSTGGPGIDYGYDTAKRLASETSYGRALGFVHDAAGNRTRLTYPDSNFIQYDYDALDRLWKVRENGATSGVGLLVTSGYDPLSRRESLTRGNGTTTGYGYDLASRLNTLTQGVAGTSADLTRGFTHNLAGQIRTRTSNNTLFDWAAPNVTKSYVANGLNRYTTVAGVNITYDIRGNLIGDGTRTFSYDVENRLLSVGGSASVTLDYDPLGRLRQTVAAGTTTQFLYDGDRLVAEYNGSGTLVRRYVHGAGIDEPLVWYEGAGLGDRRWLHADERGSVLASTDGAGTATAYQYGPYGEPTTWSGSRFKYTGQIALHEAQLYHYKSRVYDPVLGRFLQTDPVGYKDDVNLYAYVRNDPVNAFDPIGLLCVGEGTDVVCDTALEVVEKIRDNLPDDASRREYGGYVTSQSAEEYSKSAEGSGITGDDAGNVYSYTQVESGQHWVQGLTGTPPENAVAGWHSHPSQVDVNGVWEDMGPSANFFSSSLLVTPTGPGNLYDMREGDIAWVYQKKLGLYLIAPNREIKLASPREILPYMYQDPVPGERPRPVLRYSGVR